MKSENPINAREWQSGDPINKDTLNDIVKAFNGGKGIKPPSQKMPTSGFNGKLKQMVFKNFAPDTELDYIICRTWDGTTEGTEDIKVGKPVGLRYETTRNLGSFQVITYSWSTAISRQAANTSTFITENQVIVPQYVVDDLILVATCDYTEVYDEDDNPIYYVDSNNAGRAWAKEITP